MDARCHHHPDSEAAGSCCYCDRPMCAECLLTNREGKSFCRREEECLAYQDALSFPGERASSPITDLLVDESSLDAQVRRLSVTLEELEELKGVLGDSSAAAEEPASPLEAEPRIPGFCAWKLAEEAVALQGLIAARVDFIRKEQELSGSSFLLERADEVQAFLEQEAGPKIRECHDWAERYSDVGVSRRLESMGKEAKGGGPDT